jgi:molybdate transport system substrate-binding protein
MGLSVALAVGAVMAAAVATPASADEIRLLTGGAYRGVAVALVPAFERGTGHKVTVANDTVGALVRRIAGGEGFDVAVVTPAALETLGRQGRVVPGRRTDLAKVGVGVMVRAGAPKPDVSTVEAFKRAVLEAKSIAYIDPESGGSSGIYVSALLARLGLAEAVKSKTRLKRGGHVSDLIVSGEAELGIHQMSEIVPTAAVTLAGPLPPEIQNYTTYSAGIAMAARDRAAAEALIAALAGLAAGAVLAARGMLRP